MQVSRINSKVMEVSGTATRGQPPRIDPGCSKVCLHVLTGRVDVPKVCTRQFECYHCGFDQLLDEMDAVGNSRPETADCATIYV